MKKRSSALLEKAIRLSTLQKMTESEIKKLPKRQETEVMMRQESKINPMDLNSILTQTKT